MVYGSMRCLYMCSLHPGSGTKAKAQVKEGGELLIRIKIGRILIYYKQYQIPLLATKEKGVVKILS